MSSQPLNFKDLVETWTAVADTKNSNAMVSEIKTFIGQCREECGMKIVDVQRAKAQIMRIWVHPDWNIAKAKNPTWTNKAWYEKRKNMLSTAFHEGVQEAFADEVAKVKKSTMLEGKTRNEAIEDEWLDNVVKLGKLARVAK